MLAVSCKLGGVGHEVQVDETCYGGAKYFRGKNDFKYIQPTQVYLLKTYT